MELAREGLEGAQKIVALSSHSAGTVAEDFPDLAGKTLSFPGGVDTELFRPDALDRGVTAYLNGGPGRGPTGRPRPPRLPVEGVDAQLRLDEFADATGVDLPVGPYDTAAGWLVSRLGRIPRAGDGATHEDPRLGEVRLVVTRMGGRRVEEIRVERVEPEDEGPPEPERTGPAAVEAVGTDG